MFGKPHLILLCLVGIGVPVAVGCGGDGGSSSNGSTTTLDVTLKDFTVEPILTSTSAGAVTFKVKNKGKVAHDFLVIRTDLPVEGLPVQGGAVVPDGTTVNVLGVSNTLLPGASDKVPVDLVPGAYVLICNIPTHYELGMRTAFVAT